MWYQLSNLLLLILLFYVIYLKKDFFMSSEDFLNLTEEFEINHYGSAPNFKPIQYTLTVDKSLTNQHFLTASGTEHQTYHTVIDKISPIMSLKNIATNGSLDNIDKIMEGSVDLAICQEDIAIENLKEHPNIRFVAGMYNEYFILLADNRKGIKSWKDLADKKVGFPSKKSGSFQNALKLSKIANLEPGVDFAYKNVDSINRLMNLFQQEQFDAIYVTSSVKNPYLINTAKNLHVNIIGTGDLDTGLLKSYFPHSRPSYINTNSFQENVQFSQFINTMTTRAILISSEIIDEKVIYQITKNLFQNIETIKEMMDNHLYSSSRNNFMKDAFIPSLMFDVFIDFPIHQGAKKYYEEIGFIQYEKIDN